MVYDGLMLERSVTISWCMSRELVSRTMYGCNSLNGTMMTVARSGIEEQGTVA